MEITSSHITDLASTATWRQALDAMLISCDLVEDASPVLPVTAALIGLLDELRADRDQPALQRLLEVADQLRTRLGNSQALRDIAVEVADRLRPIATAPAIELAAAAVPWETPGAAVQALLHVAELADRPVLIATARRAIAGSVSRLVNRLDQADMQRAARDLLAAGTPGAAALGLGIVQVAGRSAGWQAPWGSLVRELRQHEDADVKAAALAMFMSPE